jgi:hypothetical protein
MRQAIHIFAKDMRALWPQILLVLALTAAAPAVERELVTWALVLARCYLIVCAIHQERLAGDRQWWLTRPYSWKSLLVAKALFLLAFVNLPLFIADLVSVKAAGLPLGSAWGNIWMRQIVLAPIWQYGLPAMALAAVTEGLISFALAGLGGVAAVVITAAATDGLTRWGLMGWVPLCLSMIVFAVVPIAVLLWQYGRRRTPSARALLGSAPLICVALVTLPLAGWGVAIATQMLRAPADVEGIRLRFGDVLSIAFRSGEDRQAGAALRLRVEGVPSGIRSEPELLRLNLEVPDGTRWDSGWHALSEGWDWEEQSYAGVSVLIPQSVLESVGGRSVRMRLSLLLKVLGPVRTEVANLRYGQVTVNGIGTCALRDRMLVQEVNCWGGAPPGSEVSVPVPGYGFPRSLEWPFRMSFDASPLWRTSVRLPPYFDDKIAFLLRKRVAYLRRDVVIEKIRLSDYL